MKLGKNKEEIVTEKLLSMRKKTLARIAEISAELLDKNFLKTACAREVKRKKDELENITSEVASIDRKINKINQRLS